MFPKDDIARLEDAGFHLIPSHGWYACDAAGMVAVIRPSQFTSKELLVIDVVTGMGWRIQRHVLNGVRQCIDDFNTIHQAGVLTGWTILDGEEQLRSGEAAAVLSVVAAATKL